MTRALTLAALLILATVGGAAITPAGVAAQEDDGLFSMSVDDCSSLSCQGAVWAASFDAPDPMDFIRDVQGTNPTVNEEANELQTFVNDHNESLLNQSNQVLEDYNATVQNTTYVLKLDVTDEEDGSTNVATRYFVAEADGENITAIRAVNETDLEADRTHELSWNEAEQLNSDVRSYNEEYVEPGETPDKIYITKMVARYNIAEVATGDGS